MMDLEMNFDEVYIINFQKYIKYLVEIREKESFQAQLA